jgi:hypothetical protein
VTALFNQHADNQIAAAEDEARMLGQPRVAPEHLLLAFTRRGRVQWLLREREISPGDIYAAIVDAGGLGDDLVLGRLPRLATTDQVLERAVEIAGQRGELSPGDEAVLLALGEDERASAVLGAVGVSDVEQLVNARYPSRRAALTPEQVKRHLLRVAMNPSPPPGPRPRPPVFERFTAEARRAVRAASESATLLENRCVEPFHLILGCLHVPESVAARVLTDALAPGELGPIGEAMEKACRLGPNPVHQATGIFAETTRRIVGEEALKEAYRRGHEHIGTGHLLLAALDGGDRTAARIIGPGPSYESIARSLSRALPGNEHPLGEVTEGTILFDVLIRILTLEFRKIVPAGWTLWGSGRSGGIRGTVPNSSSEEDVRIDLDWIAAVDGPAPERLVAVTHRALEDLQAAAVERTGRSWPTGLTSGTSGRPPAHAEIVGDEINPMLRLWYGESEGSDALEAVSHPILLNSVLA